MFFFLQKATLAMFSEIDIPLHYQVSVVALSAAGVGKASILYKEISRYSKNSRAEDTLWVTLVQIGLAALFVLIIGIAGFSVLRRPKKRFYVVST